MPWFKYRCKPFITGMDKKYLLFTPLKKYNEFIFKLVMMFLPRTGKKLETTFDKP